MAETDGENAFPFDFEEYVAELEEYYRPENKHLRGKEGFEWLTLFIGGFEHWPLLNYDCKRKVVSFLGYKTRCMLARCSKSDHDIVESTPISIDCINIGEYRGKECLDITLTDKEKDQKGLFVSLDFNARLPDRHTYHFRIYQHNEDTIIRLDTAESYRELTIPNRNYRQEWFEFIENWMKKCQYGIKELMVTAAEYPFELSQIKSLPNCKFLLLGSKTVDIATWWLQKCPQRLDWLHLHPYDDDLSVYTSEFLGLPGVMNAADLRCRCKAPFTDDQFARLNNRRIGFRPVAITEVGLNMFLKKWARGEAHEHFEIASLYWGDRVYDDHKVLEGLLWKSWEGWFRSQQQEFCTEYERRCGVGRFYQVSSYADPYSSLTVAFHPQAFAIRATGKKATVNGRDTTVYKFVQ